MKDILDLIETARRDGRLGNEQARLASVALSLEGDDAMLANRIISQGVDPASLEYLAKGEVSAHIALAHQRGPGSLIGAEKNSWLLLASLSADESKDGTLRGRVLKFFDSLSGLEEAEHDARMARRLIESKESEIASLPFRVRTILGREMRVYDSDLGFAAAYWAGEPCAAVLGSFGGKPYGAVASNGVPLANLLPEGTPAKLLSPCFGILEDPEVVATLA